VTRDQRLEPQIPEGPDNTNMSARRSQASGALGDKGSSESIAASTSAVDAPPSDAAPVASSTRKQPPPEKTSDVRRRTYIILSFWLIVLLLGLPIWWETTTIYRANLPLSEMLDWADGKVRDVLAMAPHSASQP
jgi:GPI-anchor transamidase subunit S